MAQVIKPTNVNFEELVKNSNITLSLNTQTKMINHLKNEFTEEQQQWYIANLYVYMNYHPTNDYPINLEHVFKMIGFANKGNAMKTIKSNFTRDEDYKIMLFHTEKRKNEGGFNKEDVMLNIDTFKNLCMMAKTQKGKEIRKYYVKLENIYNEIIKSEIEEQKKILEEQKKQIQLLENKPETEGFGGKSGFIYIIRDEATSNIYKIGLGEDANKRYMALNSVSTQKSLKLISTFKTNNTKNAEKIIHLLLDPFKIKKRNEWFCFCNETEFNYAIYIIKRAIEFTDKYNFINYESFKTYAETIDKEELDSKEHKKISNTNFLCKTDKLSKYNGVSWSISSNNWTSRLTKNNQTIFLGRYNTEIEAAIVYNDYATYLNNTEGTNYQLNEIEEYIPNPRNIPEENLKKKYETKTSKYNGVYFIKSLQIFEASITYKKQKYILLKHEHDIECAKIYNEQALFFNNHLGTNYHVNDIPDFITVEKNHIADLEITKRKRYSRFSGVTIRNDSGKFRAYIKHNRKVIHLGTYATELEAAKAYNKKADELNALETTKFKYRLNEFDENEQ